MSQATSADDIAEHLAFRFYTLSGTESLLKVNGENRMVLYTNGLNLLHAASQLWPSNPAPTSTTKDQIMNCLRNASSDEQRGLCALIKHCLGDDRFQDRSDEYDYPYYHLRGFKFPPVIWIFKINPPDLMVPTKRERHGEIVENSTLDLLRTQEKMWLEDGDNKNDHTQITPLARFATDLKLWASGDRPVG